MQGYLAFLRNLEYRNHPIPDPAQSGCMMYGPGLENSFLKARKAFLRKGRASPRQKRGCSEMLQPLFLWRIMVHWTSQGGGANHYTFTGGFLFIQGEAFS